MLTEDEQLQQAFSRGQQALGQKRDDDAAMRAAYEKYHPPAGGGAAINEGSAKRPISPGAVIGGIIGGIGGGLATSPAGGWGAIPGAIAGAGIGEAGQQAYDTVQNNAYAPHSSEESLKRIGTEMAYSAAGEAGAAGVMGAKTLVFGRPVSYAQPRQLTAEQIKTKTFLDRHQIPYTPDQITGSTFHNFARSIADNGALSEKGMQDFFQNQQQAIRGAITDVADTMGQHVPLDKLGAEVADYIGERSKTIQDAIVNPWYNTIANHMQYTQQIIPTATGNRVVTQGGLLVDVRPLKQQFAREVAELEKNALNTGDTGFKKLTETTPAYSTMKQFLGVEDDIQWAAAHQTLKSTREQLRALDNPMDVVASRQYDKGKLVTAETSLEKQMETALSNSPNPAHQADLALWKQAQAVVKGRSEQFKNDVTLRFVKSIQEHGGDKGMTQFMNTMTADDMGKVWKATRSNPELQDSMRRAFLEDRINKAGGMADENAPFDATKFRKLVFGKDEAGSHKTDVLFNPTQKAKLNEFIDAAEQAQLSKGGGIGEMFMRLKSSSAVFQLPLLSAAALGLGGWGAGNMAHGSPWTGAAELTGAVSIVLGPSVLAGMLKNPRTAEYMIQGLRYSSTSNQAIRVTRELMRLDQGFANAVRLGVSAYNAEQTSGPIHRTAETVQKGMADTTQSIFGNQQ